MCSDLFDCEFPQNEQLPRKFYVEFRPTSTRGRAAVMIFVDGQRVGDVLTDNSHVDDGYRFHDAFHFAHAAVLGWSPMVRSLLKRKRKSRADVDEIEDGGRAKILEETICALIFAKSRETKWFENGQAFDVETIRTVKSLTSQYEVQSRSESEWREAICQGYRAWKLIRENDGGILIGDLRNRSLEVMPRKRIGPNSSIGVCEPAAGFCLP